MKKLVWLFSTILLVTMLTSCTKDPPTNSSATDNQAPFFQLSTLPKLAPYTPLQEKATRYYPDYTDHVIPSKDYGKLMPYIGKIVGTQEDYALQFYYGLINDQGKIVVDPIYNSAYFSTVDEDNGEEILVLSQWEDENLEKAKTTIVASDGSWCIGPIKGYFTNASDNRIIVSVYGEEAGDPQQLPRMETIVYDTNGKQLYTSPASFWEFSEGLAPARISQAMDKEYYQYIDLAGKTVIAGPFSGADIFRNGVAPVKPMDSELWGVIDKKGNYIVKPQYSYLTAYQNGLATFTDTNQQMGIIDTKGKVIVPAMKQNFFIYETNPLICQIYNDEDKTSTFKNFTTNQAMTGPERPGKKEVCYYKNGYFGFQYQDGYVLFNDNNEYDLTDALSIEEMNGILFITYGNKSMQMFDTNTHKFGKKLNYDYSLYYLDSSTDAVGIRDNLTGKLGVMDKKGNIVLPPQYSSLTYNGKDFYMVQKGIYSGVIDKKGNWLICLNTNTID